MPLLQIDGLASGLQTGAIIQSILAAERIPIQRLEAKQLFANARKAAFQSLSIKLTNFSNALKDLLLASALNKKLATFSSTTPPLTVVANADAVNGAFNVTVKQLATATKIDGTTGIGQKVDPDALLKDAGLLIAPTTTTGTSTGTFIVNGTAISVDHDTESLNDIIAKITANVAGVTATLVDSTGTPDAAGNHVKLESASAISIGTGGDTSNFLEATRLLAAPATAATVTGATASTGALASTEIHIDGVIVTTTVTAAGNTAAENAASIAADINSTAGIKVVATGNVDGTITLTAKSGGVNSEVDVTQNGTGTGLSVATTTQATDTYISTSGLGTTQIATDLANARLDIPIAGLDGDGNGEFKVNGVTIAFNENETIGTILSRISSSSAGVIANYDAITDQVILTSKETGSSLIALEDTTGSFLAAVGVLAASQAAGQNAVYSVDTVAGGADQTSSSNIVSGVIPGVTLTLTKVSTTAETVTISQDTGATVSKVQAFVKAFNDAMTYLKDTTKIDPDGDDDGTLSGDATVRAIEYRLRGFLVSQPVGAAGSYRDLSTIGLTFGDVGSEVGSTNELKLDSTKLTEALKDNPEAVYTLLSGFSSTATLDGGGTAAVASISGTPGGHYQAGTYEITTTVAGSISAIFTPTGGSAGLTIFGSTLTAGGVDTLSIPGIKITATDPLVDGTSYITVTVQEKGVLRGLSDYLKSLTSSTGMISVREESIDAQVLEDDRRIEALERRVALRRERLEARFAALEGLMSQLQSQSAVLGAQLLTLANSQS